MIEDPDKYLEDFAKAGADYITVHAEACTHLHRTLCYIKELGKKAGVALNPHTEPDVLKYVVDHVDLVLVMSVNPGFGGQKFIESVIPKISEVKEIFEQSGKKDLYLSVDGGINFDTAPKVVRAGANVLVAGNTIYGSKSVSESISKLRQSAVAA